MLVGIRHPIPIPIPMVRRFRSCQGLLILFPSADFLGFGGGPFGAVLFFVCHDEGLLVALGFVGGEVGVDVAGLFGVEVGLGGAAEAHAGLFLRGGGCGCGEVIDGGDWVFGGKLCRMGFGAWRPQGYCWICRIHRQS